MALLSYKGLRVFQLQRAGSVNEGKSRRKYERDERDENEASTLSANTCEYPQAAVSGRSHVATPK